MIATRGEAVYRPEVDGLRGIAVAGVILFHAGLGAATGGYVGVDVFFVISGYLISSIILREMDQGRFRFARFYERRIRRIFPAMFVVSVATFIGSCLVLPPEQFQTFAQSLVATTLFVSNIFFWLKSGYFDGPAELAPLNHMWSLSVEEQFYVVFPFMLLVGFMFRKRFLTAFVIASLLLSLLLCIYATQQHPMTAFFHAPLRAWELMAGVVITLHEKRWRQALGARPKVSMALEAIGLILIVSPMFVFNAHTPFPGTAAIIPVLGSALVILVSTSTSPIGRLLASRPMVGLGLISYSAYLWHQPVFALSRSAGLVEAGAFVLPALIVASLALAYLSWRFVEQPFRRAGRFSQRQVFGGFVVFSGVLLAAGLAGHVTGGLPQRYGAETLALHESSAYSPKRDQCHTDGLDYIRPADSCRYLTENTRWAVFSDSHGPEIAYALAQELQPHGEGVLHLTFSGCEAALLYESSGPGCTSWIRESLEYLESQPGIERVLVIFRYSFHLYGDQLKTYPELPGDRPRFLPDETPARARAAYVESLTEIIRRLSAAGKQVYVVKPVPELVRPAEQYIFDPKRSEPGRVTGPSMEYYSARNAYILPAFASIDAIPNVTVLDPTLSFCSRTQCASIIDGQGMYYDDNHLSVVGSRYFLRNEIQRGVLDLGVTVGHQPDEPVARVENR